MKACGARTAIVQDIVKIHGGQIEIKSSPNEGTQIILYFPVIDYGIRYGKPSLQSSLSKP